MFHWKNTSKINTPYTSRGQQQPFGSVGQAEPNRRLQLVDLVDPGDKLLAAHPVGHAQRLLGAVDVWHQNVVVFKAARRKQLVNEAVEQCLQIYYV